LCRGRRKNNIVLDFLNWGHSYNLLQESLEIVEVPVMFPSTKEAAYGAESVSLKRNLDKKIKCQQRILH
jgi:hypothetical protein